MKINRVDVSRECFNIKSNMEEVNNKLLKHQKTEKIFENGLTNNSKLKLTLTHIHESLINKNYTLNVAIVGESTNKEIPINGENIHKKFRL